MYVFSFLSLVPSFSVLLTLSPPNSALPKHIFLLLLAASSSFLGHAESLSQFMFSSSFSSLFTNDQCFPLSFFDYFILLFSTYGLVQGCPFLVPLFLQVTVLGTHRQEALSSRVWLNVSLAPAWGELACSCCVCGAWSALRAKRGGDGTFGELHFWNGSLLGVGKGSVWFYYLLPWPNK